MFEFKNINNENDFIFLLEKNKNNLDNIIMNNTDPLYLINNIKKFKIKKLEINNFFINNISFNKLIKLEIEELKIINCKLEKIFWENKCNIYKLELKKCNYIDIIFKNKIKLNLLKLSFRESIIINLKNILLFDDIVNNLVELDLRNCNLISIDFLKKFKKLKTLKLDKNNINTIPYKLFFIENLKFDKNKILINNILSYNGNNYNKNLFENSKNHFKKNFEIFLKDLNNIEVDQLNVYFNKLLLNYFNIIFNLNMLILFPEIINKLKENIKFLCFYLILKIKYFYSFDIQLFNIFENCVKNNLFKKEIKDILESINFLDPTFHKIIIDYYYNRINKINNYEMNYILNNSKNENLIKELEYYDNCFGPLIINNQKNGFYLFKNSEKNFEIILFYENKEIINFKSKDSFIINNKFEKIDKIHIFNGINKYFYKIILKILIKSNFFEFFMIYKLDNSIIRLYHKNDLISEKEFYFWNKRYSLIYSLFFNKLFWKKNNKKILWEGFIYKDKKNGKGLYFENNEYNYVEFKDDKEITKKKLISIMEESEEDLQSKIESTENLLKKDDKNLIFKDFNYMKTENEDKEYNFKNFDSYRSLFKF